MRIKELFNDDDAVSPVIGVILMVAITVILAAVIASFVLGLGDQTQSATPQASFSFDYDAGPGNDTEGVLSITHDGGDTLNGDEVYVRGSGLTDDGAGSIPAADYDLDRNTSPASWSNAGGSTEISAGNGVDVAVRNFYDIRVVYESAEGDSSATLGQDTGPEA
ncbi:type IV pilin N-terminal domain-containing protein [Haloarcula montana]|uniref:type IV pilin N-terminal domain-containing protein n=1 Tax=Haloarcula montana TaxID=3111776 RepID=UPI002D76E3F4|nr:type IV pilin N-terminal domain-containing protein [Haloarcula sp. GH36]